MSSPAFSLTCVTGARPAGLGGVARRADVGTGHPFTGYSRSCCQVASGRARRASCISCGVRCSEASGIPRSFAVCANLRARFVG
jgi:hypothetical protein